MADRPVAVPGPRPIQALQRCPNCEARADVSFYVAGSLARCSRCGVRFEVKRPTPPQVQRPADPAFATPSPAPAASIHDHPTEVPLAQAQAEPAPMAAAEPSPTRAERATAAKNEPPLPALQGLQVLERLGQGGMGEVFRCVRPGDGRPLAVKILTPQMAAVPDYVRRFEREAAAMAQLDHPGIVRLLGRGRSGHQCYIAMELIEGASLRAWAARERPNARVLARLLAQIAHALAYAHARGVVHRDLKPDNVLVTRELRTKVLDFGLAGLHLDGAEVLTQSHVAMGTANYMAPEQRKDAKRADHKADLYSFGVMAYELLTGELPVGRFAPPTRLCPALDRAWDGIVERCLEQDPAARPHSALELAHALEALAGTGPATELGKRGPRPAQRSRLWSWLGLGAGLAVILGMTGLGTALDHSGALARGAQVAAGRSLAAIAHRPAAQPRGLHRAHAAFGLGR